MIRNVNIPFIIFKTIKHVKSWYNQIQEMYIQYLHIVHIEIVNPCGNNKLWIEKIKKLIMKHEKKQIQI